MITTAKKLLAKLTYLELAGVGDDGDYEWIGTDEEWTNVFNFGVELQEESIQHE